MDKIIIFGASYPDVIKLIKTRENVIGFVDDSKFGYESHFLGFPVIGDSGYILNELDKNSALVINNVHASPRARFQVANKIKRAGQTNMSLIHSNNNVDMCQLGLGIFMHECYLGANVTIGNHASIKIGSIISHDNIIDDYAFIGPGVTLCGCVRVGRGAYIGAGAVIKERVIVGEGAVVGAGAVVLKNVDPWTTVVGNPARKIKELESYSFEDENDSI